MSSVRRDNTSIAANGDAECDEGEQCHQDRGCDSEDIRVAALVRASRARKKTCGHSAISSSGPVDSEVIQLAQK